MISYRKNIEDAVFSRCAAERAKHTRKEIKWNPILSGLARNHSLRMSRREKLWEHDKPSKIPELIKNPIEATIAWTLITLGFLVAWVFALLGLLILWLGREGYKKKKREHVAAVSADNIESARKRPEEVAAKLYEELAANEAYGKSLMDSDFKLSGIGVSRKRNVLYITQIFYG